LRIHFVGLHYAPEPSGNAPYTTAISRGLARRGHVVHVTTGVPHYPEWRVRPDYRKWTSATLEEGVSISRLRHYVPRNPSLAHRAVMELSFGARASSPARVNASRPDVVVVVSPALLASALVMARQRRNDRRPALGLWVQDVYSSGMREIHGGGRLGSVSEVIEKRVFQAADGIAVAHQRFQDRVTESFGLDRGTVRVIRNWTHMAPLATTSGRSAARRRMGWGSEVVVLHAGNMGLKQGLSSVIESARLADRSGANVRFVLLGGGHQEAALRDAARGVICVDFVSSMTDADFQEALCAADVLLVNEAPGVTEMSVPSKLTSYFLSGRPVLAATRSNSVTAAEVSAAGAGIQVTPGDPAGLLTAALALGLDKSRCAELGGSARRFASANLTQESALDQFEDWLLQLTRRRRNRTD